MEVAEILTALGGVATRASLVAATSRADVDRALRAGSIVRLTHGRYALPTIDDARGRAHALAGVLSLTSAALHHGWAVKSVPDRPHVTVPRRRKVSAARRAGVQLHYRDLTEDEIVDGIATSKVATLLDCLRLLPFDQALAVADSALRAGERSALVPRLPTFALRASSRACDGKAPERTSYPFVFRATATPPACAMGGAERAKVVSRGTSSSRG